MILLLNDYQKGWKKRYKPRVFRLKSFRSISNTSRLLFIICLLSGLNVTARAQAWRLVWSDEFKGAAGAPVDARKWKAEIGGGGWGNKEFEYYSDGTKNAHLDGHGSLAITALQETLSQDFKCWYGQCRYTSARLMTKERFAQAYGRFEARIKIPYGQGIWPAFWLLGDDIEKVGWPVCGEIDIMENIGREPAMVHG